VTTYLLDANVLIALTVAEHEHHQRALAWVATIDRFAVCPIVEGALVRFLVRLGESPEAARQVLRAVHSVAGFEFWADSVSYSDADLGQIRGHRQVTDAYLVSLAASHPDALLATLDMGLAQAAPGQTQLLPIS
jgi:toxin-antitoxin system PIN domain toxin